MKYYSLHVTNLVAPTPRAPTIRGNWRVAGWYPTERDVKEAVARLAQEPLGLTRWMIFYHRNQRAEGVLIHSDGVFTEPREPIGDTMEEAHDLQRCIVCGVFQDAVNQAFDEFITALNQAMRTPCKTCGQLWAYHTVAHPHENARNATPCSGIS